MTAEGKTHDDELEDELAAIVLNMVEGQKRAAGEHMIRQVVFRLRMQPLLGAIERLQKLGLRDRRNQLVRLQYLKPMEGVRVEFGRFTATVIALPNDTCRVDLMQNEGSLVNVELHESVGEADLPEIFREIMHRIAGEGQRPVQA